MSTLQTARHFRSKTLCDKIKTESSKKIEKEIWSNKPLLCFLVFTVLFGYYLILVPNDTLNDFFQLLPMNDQNFRFLLILITICNFFVAMYTEKELMPMVSKWWSGKLGSASDDKSEQVKESDSHLNQKEQLVSNRN